MNTTILICIILTILFYAYIASALIFGKGNFFSALNQNIKGQKYKGVVEFLLILFGICIIAWAGVEAERGNTANRLIILSLLIPIGILFYASRKNK